MEQGELGEKLINQNVIGLNRWIHINKKSDCVQKGMSENSNSNPSPAVN